MVGDDEAVDLGITFEDCKDGAVQVASVNELAFNGFAAEVCAAPTLIYNYSGPSRPRVCNTARCLCLLCFAIRALANMHASA